MAWPKKELGELADICRGSSPRPITDTRYFDGGTIPWIKIADATKSGKFLYETKQHVNEYGASFSRLLAPGTILVAASGTLGYTQILGVEGCAHDGWLILQNLRGLDRDFAYYALKTLEKHFFNSGSGAAIQNINTDILRQTEIPHPPLPIQRRIAGILSAYDELIENNQRRIRILEQMARSLYREWFVHFRYPGHENVPLVPSPLGEIPQGWEVKKLGDVFNFIGGSQPPKIEHIHEERPGYVRFIQNRDYGSSSHLTYIIDSRRNKHCDRLDIMVDKYGEPGRTRFGLDGAYNVALAKIAPYETHHREWLRGLISEPEFNTYLAGASMAATRASLNSSHFTVQVAVPPAGISKAFHDNVEPLLKLVLTHQDLVANLRRTRDLLLPRLLSGQIDVEALPS